MRSIRTRLRRKLFATACSGGMLLQLGSCDLGTVTVPVTLQGDELLITMVRGLILTPIDTFITNTIRGAFEDDDE